MPEALLVGDESTTASVVVDHYQAVSEQILEEIGHVGDKHVTLNLVFVKQLVDGVAKRDFLTEQLPEAMARAIQGVVLLVVEVHQHGLARCLPGQNMGWNGESGGERKLGVRHEHSFGTNRSRPERSMVAGRSK